MIFNVTKKKTFDCLPRIIDAIKMMAEKEIVVMLIGNKIDISDKREVSREEAMQFAQQNNFLYDETSVYSPTNLNTVFETLVKGN